MADPYLTIALQDGLSDSACRTYKLTFAKCQAATKCKDARTMLLGRANTFRKLAELWPVTKTLSKALSLMCTITRTNPDIVSEAIKAYWSQRLQEANATVRKEDANNVVSPELKAKWMDWDLIEAKVAELIATGKAHASLKASQELVILAIYAFLPPKRADFGKVRIVASSGKIADDENGLVLPSKGECTLVLNDYKTAKTYGPFTEALPKELETIVRASLKAFPRTFLLVGPRDKPLSDDNYGTRVKNAMDRHMNKTLGINDLRKMYITQTIDLSKVTHEKRAAIAHSMMHSPSVQLLYVRVLHPT